MGEVYLADDTRLNRKVALKILPPEMAADQQLVRRFLQEAKAVSALNHPNVCVIHEVGEMEDGRPFITMEHIEGTSLQVRINAGGLAGTEVVDVGIQVADALDEAHAKGITHRDIKPGNIMITPRGQVKVLDFGLAKIVKPGGSARTSELLTQAKTDPGMVVGTVQYMSPEQAMGQEVDHRTDIFSLGVVLYEMATGTPPFKGPTPAAVFDAILHHTPPPPRSLNPACPAELEQIIARALEKDRELRYQTASDLRAELKRLKRDSESARIVIERVPRRLSLRRWAAGSVALAVLVIAAATIHLLTGRSPSIDSVAVLPLMNATSDPNVEYLSDGITESIINSLSQLAQLRVMARSTVFRYKGREVDPREVGRDLKVGAVLTGRVSQRGDIFVIQTELVDVASGSQLWGERYTRKITNILGLQEEISQQITQKLRLKLSGEQKQRLSRRDTQDNEAYQANLKGRYYWNRRTEESLKRAITFFQAAISRDPSYALAYAGLADSYLVLGDSGFAPPKQAYPKAREAAEKALQIDEALAEAHTSLAFIKLYYDWDWPGADSEFNRALRLSPGYATAHHWYGNALVNLGQFNQGIAHLKQAQELDPLSLIISSAVGSGLYYARRYDQAIDQFRKTLDLDPSFVSAHRSLGRAYGQKSMYLEAIQEFEKARELSGGDPTSMAALGHLYAIAGRTLEARRTIVELKVLAEQRYVPAYHLAAIYTGLGERGLAFEFLEKAFEERSSLLVYLKVDPYFDGLRSDPRFGLLVQRIRLPA